jgi:hypothetical protein
MAILNEANNNADSRRSVTYYDANNVAGGPLFSVFVGFEINGPSSNAYDDASAISVDPSTGDLYIIAFDSGVTPGQVDRNLHPSVDPINGDAGAPLVDVPEDDDTIADWDLYRINFQTVLGHYTANMEGHDLRNAADPAPDVGGPAPTATAGGNAAELLDYVTYGSATPYLEERMADGNHNSPEGVFDQTHSNTFVLDGAIEKVGELNRNAVSSSPFHVPSLSFISDGKMIMIDDFRQDRSSPHNLANDADYRMIERVSTSPGAATSDNINGGYNNTTTESWEARRIAQMNLDSDDGGSFLSEPHASAYYDNGAGVRGIWVADRDDSDAGSENPVPDAESGDDIAFLQLDDSFNSLGYRQFTLAGNPTKFDMDNIPGTPNPTQGGRVGNLFVDEDTGDLIIVEEGFRDSLALGGPGALEPAVFRRSVNYDSGGKIDLGAYHDFDPGAGVTNKLFLAPAKNTGDTAVERGYWSAYDSATDKIYFSVPAFGSETPPFEMDVYVLDLTTGVTSSFLDTDNSVSMFTTSGNVHNADKVVAFTLEDGDYNDDGTTDAADYVAWRKLTSMFGGDPGGYEVWRKHFGEPGLGAGGAPGNQVPEPAGVTMLAIALAALYVRRRSA